MVTRLLKCCVCGKVKKSQADSHFNCCSVRQKITDANWLNKPLSQSIEPAKALEIEQSIDAKSNTKAENPSLDLEIEEEEHENPLEKPAEPLKTSNELIPCPDCNFMLKEYETPCPNCNALIEWGED